MARTTTVDATNRLASIHDEIKTLDKEIDGLASRARNDGFDSPADTDVDPSDLDEDADYETVEDRHDAKVNDRVDLEGKRDEFVESLIEWTSTDKLASKCDTDDATELLRQVGNSPEFNAFDAVQEAKSYGGNVYDAMVDACVAAGDGVFEIKRLSWGESNEAADKTVEVSYDYDDRGNVQGMPKEGVYKTVTANLAIVDAPVGAPGDTKEYPYAVGEWVYDKVNAWNTRGDTDMGNTYLRDKLE